ncbi:diguanylate cyclase [Frankia sp. CNm7]|uniref:diguanylate cyclase domain-containing protein n=1 Tax=Frankia nepalensis TaxID=1836974 RepID=UPI001932DD1F|nr:diguanylate cyclase [Frankia nepalensis]MBL7521346.1 diguanylate cyclase [Frankia nepalensis]
MTAVDRYEDVFDALQTGMIVTRVADGRLCRVNSAACRILGRDGADLLGSYWPDLIDPTQRAELADRAERLDTTRDGVWAVVRFLRPDGTLVHSLSAGTVLDAGTERCFLTQLLDVSNLVAADWNLRLVLDNAPVSMFVVDQEGRVPVTGGCASRAVATSLRHAARSGVFEVFGDQPEILRMLRRALGGTRSHDVVTVDDSCYDLNLIPVTQGAGRPLVVVGVVSDVTDRERAATELRVRTDRQTALADLAQRALEMADEAELWRLGLQTLTEQLDADEVTVRDHASRRASAVPPAARPGGAEPDGVEPGDTEPGDTELGGAPRAAAAAGAPGGVGLTAGVDRPAPQAADPSGGDGTGEPVRRPEHGRVTAGDDPDDGALTPAAWVPVGRVGDRQATIIVRRAGRPLTTDELAFARSVAALLGAAALRIRMERDARYQALHDPLTGLPNRAALLRRLDRGLRRARVGGTRVGVLFIDLDGFKAVNDTLGHQAGDELLRTVADRLRREVRPRDVVGRLAGDEFAVLCDDVAGVEDLKAIGERVRHGLTAPIELRRPVSVGGSIGLAVSGPGLDEAEGLLDAADMAMYAAKRRGPGISVLFDEGLRAAAATRLNDTTALRQALAQDELIVRFAPVADRAGVIVGADALLCWRHPDRGLLGPYELDHVAVEAGLTADLDHWLVGRAGRAAAEWSATGDAPAGWSWRGPAPGGPAAGPPWPRQRRLYLRISERGAEDPEVRQAVVAQAARIAQRADGPGMALHVLLPDTLLGDCWRRADRVITELSDAGVRVGVDFAEVRPIRSAAGQDVPKRLGTIRVGPQQVGGVDHDPTSRAVFAGIVRFAHLLELEVAAREVHRPAELVAVRALGCDLAQGGAIGEPRANLPW